MLRRYFTLPLLCLIAMSLSALAYLFLYTNSITSSKPTICPNTHKVLYEEDASVFKSRLNQRLIYLGQQFSYINITKLLHIQSTATQNLTYFCSKYCGGWGDRMRGIVSTYILAALLERRFTIDMQYPCDLSHFLLPNLIDWTRNSHRNPRKPPLMLDLIHDDYAAELHRKLTTIDLYQLWAKHDEIFLTTNQDYITPTLKNPFFRRIKSQINLQSNHSNMHALFSFIFELLFKPTSIVINQIDRLFARAEQISSQSIICMHVRLGQNPTIPKDEKRPFRQSLGRDMIDFIDRNLTSRNSSIFVTSDSLKIVNDVYRHYDNKRILSIFGPIIHIDRYDKGKESDKILHAGFLKVIAEFYFLGECDVLVRSSSGFSQWASYRRLNEYSNLYMYCRGIHQITGPKWRAPYKIC
ncbi:unnamed protein product [Adineta ricciae]|uniref:Uncharacterized protein n=1 Tax=Adineta ricciae TaxID=249248 RepID=A0A814XMK8_ADIRI|nr:unnamed protein product [Adineta ricciae]